MSAMLEAVGLEPATQLLWGCLVEWSYLHCGVSENECRGVSLAFESASLMISNFPLFLLSGLSSDLNALSTVEHYCFTKERRWETSQYSLKVARWGHAVVAAQNALFAIGGRDVNWHELSSVEVSVNGGSWVLLPSGMAHARCSCAAVTVDHAVCVIGGFDGEKWTNSASLYQMEGNHVYDGVWIDLPDMPEPLAFPKAVTMKLESSRVILVAGSTMDDASFMLVAYHVELGRWAILDVGMEKEGFSLMTERNFLFCLDGKSQDLCCLNVQEESKHGSLGALCRGEIVMDVDAALSSDESIYTAGESNKEKQEEKVHDADNYIDPPLRVSIQPLSGSLLTLSALTANADLPLSDSTMTMERELKLSPTKSIPRHPRKRVENIDCVVDGKHARYSGEVNPKGQRHGEGVLVWSDSNGNYYPRALSKNSFYEGTFFEDSRKGEGILFVSTTCRLYEGTFDDGVLCGDGKLTDGNRGLVYEGRFDGGVPNGEGICEYKEIGCKFKGAWIQGKPWKGNLCGPRGKTIESGSGPWDSSLAVDNAKNGREADLVEENKAVVVPHDSNHTAQTVSTKASANSLNVANLRCTVDGEVVIYTGNLNASGKQHGYGTLIWPDDEGNIFPTEDKRNDYYEGHFLDDKRTGLGLMYMYQKSRTYRGTFENGVLTGEGTLDDAVRGLIYEGNFALGTPSGEGKCIYTRSKCVFIGTWAKGAPQSGRLYSHHGHTLRKGDVGWGVDLAVD